MADDNSARHRSNEPFGGGPAQALPVNDPLAELARLIGRHDPSSDHGRDLRPQAPVQDTGMHSDSDPIPSFLANPPPPSASEPPLHASEPAAQHYRHDPASPAYAAQPLAHQDYAAEPAPQYYAAEPAPPQYYAEEPAPQPFRHEPAPPQYRHEPPLRHSQTPAYGGQAGWAPTAAAPASGVSAPQQYAPQPSAPPYDHQAYADSNYAHQPYADPHGSAIDRPRSGPPSFTAPAERFGQAPPFYPHQSDAGGMPPPQDDEFYDEAPRGARRRRLLAVVAVLGLAVVGTAGAYGYRSMFSGTAPSAAPPIIRASGEPSKVAPPAAPAPDTSVGKFSYDRFGDAGKDEQVVRREEKPVDLSKVAPPRPAFPEAPANSSAAKPGGPAPSAGDNPPSAIGEPRRVRTVPIRPDQGGDAAVQAPAQRPTNTAALTADHSAAIRAAAPRAQTPAAARPTAAAPAANAPLSLAPDAAAATAQDSFPPPAAQAAPQPRAAAPAPTRVASAPVSGGGYLVQVSSQKTEAEAETAYRGIKSKFAGVLGGHPHTVRRADLGAKGVFYRALVGPFASREEAVQVCSGLKQAGGDCVVQH